MMSAYHACPPMHCVFESPDITRGSIFLGNIEAAANYEALRKNNIRAVLTVAGGTGI